MRKKRKVKKGGNCSTAAGREEKQEVDGETRTDFAGSAAGFPNDDRS